jgi:hypothetical protein
MGKRGPAPSHEITVIPGRSERRPPPPSDLNEAQRALWRDIVETEPQAAFASAAQRHLLRLYVEHATFRADLQRLIQSIPIERVVEPEHADAIERLLKNREREDRMLVTMATRMRLTAQSRYTASAAATAARNDAGGGPRPWDVDAAADGADGP